MPLFIKEPQNYEGDVPGTIVMVAQRQDDETLATEEHKAALKTTDGGVVLDPQPHDDPNDPLNWPMWRRDLALAVVGFHSFIVGGQTAILASAFTQMSKDFGVSLGTIAYVVGPYMLALGVGSVFFAPLAVIYGKRFVYIVSCVVWFVSCLWGGASKSFGSLVGARVLLGIGGSPTESLPSASIAEIYFLHERAYRLGIYTFLMLGGKNILPMIAAFIIGNKGYHWLFWILAIIGGMDLLLITLFVPETWWNRAPVPTDKFSIRETEMAREARAVTMSLKSRNSFISAMEHPTEDAPVGESSKDAITREPTQVDAAAPARPRHDRRPTFQEPEEPQTSNQAEKTAAALAPGPAVPVQKSYWEPLRIYGGRVTDGTYWKIALRPFVLFTYPTILFPTLIYAFSVVWLIVISETLSAIFSKAPYHFSTTTVGLLFVATFIGGCIGSLVGGRTSDIVVRMLSNRNQGVYEPEFRLVMILPVFISVCIGLMGYGWSSFDKDHWIVVCIFLGVLGFGCSLGSTTAITYAVDSHKHLAAEALVTLNLSKNVIGFCFSFFVPEFLSSRGSKTEFLVFGGIQIFLCLWAIPLYIYGKRIRLWLDRRDALAKL